MQSIHYLSTNPKDVEILNSYFKQQEVELIPYQTNAECEILLLFSPFKLDHHVYTEPAPIWKKYLERESPSTKLIVAGFKEATQHNYIDLLNLPNDLVLFLENAETATSVWKPVDTGGMDMKEKLKRFFEGHGNESVVAVLWAIKGFLNAIKINVDNGIPYPKVIIAALDTESIFKELKAENTLDIISRWKTFRNRWNHYLPLFEGLPFYRQFQYIDDNLAAIHPFFYSGCQNEEKYTPNHYSDLSHIQRELEKINKKYVK